MFLLNDTLILQYLKEESLIIENFHPDSLTPTFYYFRLGSQITTYDGSVEVLQPGREVFTIQPRGYVLIKSLENFKLPKNVLGIFGQMSRVVKRGLRLNHSPFIEPNFKGELEMGLENLLDRPKDIKLGELIGKVIFFNVTDTYPIRDIRGTIIEEEFKRRAQSGYQPVALD